MNKNFFVTLTALAVMTTLGYAAYTNGSIGDLSRVVSNQIGGVVSGGSNYFGATATLVKTPGGRLIEKKIDPKTLNVDGIVKIFGFQIINKTNKNDIIKYINFQIKGKGIITNTNEVVLKGPTDDGRGTVEKPLKLISQSNNTFVFRLDPLDGQTSALYIPASSAYTYDLSARLLRANEKSPLSVKILKIAR